MRVSSNEIREKFLKFFQERGHAKVPSSSLIPNDPSVLLTTAGVQQFKPYYVGELDPQKDFGSRRVVSVQKCFRTTDIDEVGDETHLTFFEMLGNFCFGDYWKKEAISWAHEFLVSELKIDFERISVTIFQGNNSIPKDQESYDIWRNDIGLSESKIKYALWDNFWGPTGGNGPCGPTTEIYVDGIEIWNIVFNEYFCHNNREELLAGKARLEKLKNNGIDTGMGLERLLMVLQDKKNIFETDVFQYLFEDLPIYLLETTKRVLIDHARSIVFLIGDGIFPSNKDVGYILRRLVRRYIVKLRDHTNNFFTLLSKVIDYYKEIYPELKRDVIFSVFREEEAKFSKTLTYGLKELLKISDIDTSTAFKLYESYGLPYEVIKEIGGDRAKSLNREEFDAKFKKHQEISKAGMEKRFGGHGLVLDTGELKAANQEELQRVIRLHTATHLLQQALRDVLGREVRQMGSDITTERTRFDFSFNRKLTSEEIRAVEEIVNQKVKENLPVKFIELSKNEASKTGALFFFKEKYPEKVKVYYVGKSLDSAYSKEFCGGPHVNNTEEIDQFKIIKEEAVGAGVRRIRGVIS